MVESKKVIGLFGGTFDPVHLGHIKSVDLLCDYVSFDAVHWVLSARPPHKGNTGSTINQRFELLKLALAGNAAYLPDDIEIQTKDDPLRQGKSYTFDTVSLFEERFPDSKLVLIIGGDSLQTLHTWYRYSELIDRVNWVVMHRPGYPLKVPSDLAGRIVKDVESLTDTSGGKILLFELSNFNVSSTELRRELANAGEAPGALAKQFMPSEVTDYIRRHQLYRINVMKPEQVKDLVVEALEDIKGQNISVIDIADISDFADYMVVASGTSDTHVKALARSASNSLRAKNVKPLNEDGGDIGEWVLVDFGDVVLHVMRPEVREYYDLEKLWNEDVRKMVQEHREKQDG